MPIHLLSIGNNYLGSSSQLYGCVNDARDIAAKFKPFCWSTKTIINSRADRQGIFTEGKKFLDRLNKGDLGILSISGHGTRERSGRGYNEAVVTADFELIWDTEMARLLGDRVKGSVLAVLADTCHAGGLPRAATPGKRTAKPRKVEGIKAIPISRCHTHKAEPGTKLRALRDAILYLACQPQEYAYDATYDGRPNGAMTYETLRSTDLRPEEAFGKIFKKVAKLLPNSEYDQTPMCVASAANLRRTFKSFLGAI